MVTGSRVTIIELAPGWLRRQAFLGFTGWPSPGALCVIHPASWTSRPLPSRRPPSSRTYWGKSLPRTGTAIEEPGYLPLGCPPLRRAIADECSRQGLPTTSQQVIITSGAQQGLSLVAAALLLPGDVVVIEDPLYPGQLPVLRQAGARLRTVPVDTHGLDVAALTQQVEREKPRLVLVSPTYQNPTGHLLGAEGRADIATLAGARSTIFVELYASADLSLN